MNQQATARLLTGLLASLTVGGLGLLLRVQLSDWPIQTGAIGLRDGAMREVILATQRDRALHVFDATTLQPLARYVVHQVAHRVSAAPDGRHLYLLQASTPNGGGCCALFVIDVETSRMCRLLEPVTNGPWSDGRYLFANRGNVGIDVLDARTFERLPTIKAPGVYRLYPSPDGRWLIGITNFAGPSLDIFDLERWELVRRIAIPGRRFSDGVWVGNQFQLNAAVDGQVLAWVVSPQSTTLDHSIPAPVADEWFEPAVMTLGKHIAVYEPHARWFHSGANPAGPGGVRVVDPATGRLVGSLATSLNFAQVRASSDGNRFYGLDAGEGPQPAVRLVALDARNGSILAERPLAEDVWPMSTASLPVERVPHGEIRPLPCDHAEPAPGPTPPRPSIATPVHP